MDIRTKRLLKKRKKKILERERIEAITEQNLLDEDTKIPETKYDIAMDKPDSRSEKLSKKVKEMRIHERTQEQDNSENKELEDNDDEGNEEEEERNKETEKEPEQEEDGKNYLLFIHSYSL